MAERIDKEEVSLTNILCRCTVVINEHVRKWLSGAICHGACQQETSWHAQLNFKLQSGIKFNLEFGHITDHYICNYSYMVYGYELRHRRNQYTEVLYHLKVKYSCSARCKQSVAILLTLECRNDTHSATAWILFRTVTRHDSYRFQSYRYIASYYLSMFQYMRMGELNWFLHWKLTNYS